MKDIKPNIKPFFLPQMSANYKFVISELEEMGIAYEPILISPKQLKNVQKDVDLMKIKEISNSDDDNLPPVWISEDLKICDGNHRVASHTYSGKDKIRAIRIGADFYDTCARLKIIQDRWERRQK